MVKFRRNAAATYWLLVGILLTAMSCANAQGGAPAAPPHHHVIRYIIGAVVVVAVIVFFAMKGKKAPAPEA